MTWIRRAAPPAHTCVPPMRERIVHVPSTSLTPRVQVVPMKPPPEPDGAQGDLWRCDDCGRLWRIGDVCDLCDAGRDWHPGFCSAGSVWRPARWWQRVRHWDRFDGWRA
jgi:hypothetical protein